LAFQAKSGEGFRPESEAPISGGDKATDRKPRGIWVLSESLRPRAGVRIVFEKNYFWIGK